MTTPKIKFDLQIKYGTEYGLEEEQAVLAVLRQGAPTSGEACIQFERDFAAYCGTAHARAVSNGTAALFLSLVALGIKRGDRVLTSPMTWIATAAAAVTLGAEVDFVDIDPETCNLDPRLLEAKITPNTKAILPVHLYGQCCDMDSLLAIAKRHGVAVVEDACHAVGADYKGRKSGSMGVTGCFSFHEQKNISTLGEGGMVVTNDPAVFERVALYRSHCTRVYGRSTKYCTLDESRFPMGQRKARFVERAIFRAAAIDARAVRAVERHALENCRVIGHDHPAFTQGGNIFLLVEAETPGHAHAAGLASLVVGTDSMAGVLHHSDAVPLRDREDGVHIAA